MPMPLRGIGADFAARNRGDETRRPGAGSQHLLHQGTELGDPAALLGLRLELLDEEAVQRGVDGQADGLGVGARAARSRPARPASTRPIMYARWLAWTRRAIGARCRRQVAASRWSPMSRR